MDQSSVIRVLEALGARRIKPEGSRVSAGCPFAPYRHTEGTDKNPSFVMEVNPSGPSKFFCYACKAAGKKAISLLYCWKDCTGEWRSDLHDLIRDQEGGSLRERYGKLGSYDERRRMTRRPRTETSWEVKGYERAFTLDDYGEILKTIPSYAIHRGITKEQAKRWKIGFDQEWQRMFITILDETQKMVGYSKRAILGDQEPKYLHAKDMAKEKYLYGEAFLDRRVRLGFISEGFMDVLALERYGWKNPLGTMGTKSSPQQIEKLRKWFDCVVIFPHNDKKPPPGPDGVERLPPGMDMAVDYRNALIDVGVKAYIAPFFAGRKDPGEWAASEHAAMRQRLRTILHEYEPAEERGEEGTPGQT